MQLTPFLTGTSKNSVPSDQNSAALVSETALTPFGALIESNQLGDSDSESVNVAAASIDTFSLTDDIIVPAPESRKSTPQMFTELQGRNLPMPQVEKLASAKQEPAAPSIILESPKRTGPVMDEDVSNRVIAMVDGKSPTEPEFHLAQSRGNPNPKVSSQNAGLDESIPKLSKETVPTVSKPGPEPLVTGSASNFAQEEPATEVPVENKRALDPVSTKPQRRSEAIPTESPDKSPSNFVDGKRAETASGRASQPVESESKNPLSRSPEHAPAKPESVPFPRNTADVDVRWQPASQSRPDVKTERLNVPPPESAQISSQKSGVERSPQVSEDLPRTGQASPKLGALPQTPSQNLKPASGPFQTGPAVARAAPDLPNAKPSEPGEARKNPQIIAPPPQSPGTPAAPAIPNAAALISGQVFEATKPREARATGAGEALGFAPLDLGSTRENHPVSPQTAKPEMPKPAVLQLVEAARQTREGVLEIRLSPEELGRVKLAMSPGEAGLQVTILAERADTLDLIRRHVDLLAQELRNQGHENPTFHFGENASDQRDNRSDNNHPQRILGDLQSREDSPARPNRSPINSGGGLDLRL